ncbi:MAG: preprotein translocase subunit YajC [Clostridiales bacterium]|nr:preprotein translocase subunit YajC [Clostridiales bacterium]
MPGGINTTFILVAVAMGALYFMMTSSEKKKTQAQDAMRADLRVGDRVITIGGIVGRVVTVKEETVTIETTSEKTRLLIMKRSIAQRESDAD